MDNLWSGNLVDVVNGIFAIGNTVKNAIKNGLGHVWQGIKAGVQFIADVLFIPMVDNVVSIYRNLLKTIVLIDQFINPDNSISLLSDGVDIGGTSLRIYREGLDMVIDANGVKLKFATSFFYPMISVETLSGGADAAAHGGVNSLMQLAFYFTLIAGLNVLDNLNTSSLANLPSFKIAGGFSIGQMIAASIGLYILSNHFINQSYNTVIEGNESSEYKSEYFGEWGEYWILELIGALIGLNALVFNLSPLISATTVESIAFGIGFGTGLAIDLISGAGIGELLGNFVSLLTGLAPLLIGIFTSYSHSIISMFEGIFLTIGNLVYILYWLFKTAKIFHNDI